MDAARLPDGLPAALARFGYAAMRLVGTQEIREGLLRAHAGQLGTDEAVALSEDVDRLAGVLLSSRG